MALMLLNEKNLMSVRQTIFLRPKIKILDPTESLGSGMTKVLNICSFVIVIELLLQLLIQQ